jgi:hypothetical protein
LAQTRGFGAKPRRAKLFNRRGRVDTPFEAPQGEICTAAWFGWPKKLPESVHVTYTKSCPFANRATKTLEKVKFGH